MLAPADQGSGAATHTYSENFLSAAWAAVNEALALEPDNREASYLRFDLRLASERHEDALDAANALVASDANDAMAHWRRAWALLKLNRFEEGLAAADIATALDPNNYKHHGVRSTLLAELERPEECLAALEDARRQGAPEAEFHVARGRSLSLLGDSGGALADFDRALALRPGDAEAHVGRSLAKLSVGDWRAGWTDLEWRLKDPAHPHHEFMKRAPQWRGESLVRKRLVVYSEWDHGDTFQFIRYLRLIENSGAEITLAVPEAARRLLAANFPGVGVTGSLEPGLLLDFDFHASLFSLPEIMKLETIPATVPYLAADAALIAKWRERIGVEGFRVGIIWQGSARFKRDRLRSIPLAAFAPLAAVPGVRLISVQALVGLEQLDALPPGMRVERLGWEIESNPDGFREMAAVMENLDLLIMSDTGPTHLAGALARTVWLATPLHPEWNWMDDREDSPWYPTMRLFRQKTAGDWAGVFVRMARELADVSCGRIARPSDRQACHPRCGD